MYYFRIRNAPEIERGMIYTSHTLQKRHVSDVAEVVYQR